MELKFFFYRVGNGMHALYHIEMIGGFLVLMHLHELLALDAAAIHVRPNVSNSLKSWKQIPVEQTVCRLKQ
jgi:uncharacterized protein YhhL (DUF1145 family)